MPSLKNKLAQYGLAGCSKILRTFTNSDIVSGPLTYREDGFATNHNCDFLTDPRFMKAYEVGERTGSWRGWQMRWRAYVACWAAEKAMGLPGDFVECGVNRGGLARTVVDYVDFGTSTKKFFLFDTFAGLDDRYITDAERARGAYAGGYDECYEAVVETFKDFNVRFVRGAIPDTLNQAEVDAVAYLSIDMNCAIPEIAAAEHFWERMVPGAVLLHDDYGGTRFIEQKHALDAFAKHRGVSVLTLPTGQGLIVKP